MPGREDRSSGEGLRGLGLAEHGQAAVRRGTEGLEVRVGIGQARGHGQL